MQENSFKGFKLSKSTLKALDEMQYYRPTSIQEKILPIALSKQDVIAQAQTGTGKTAAFGIPIVEFKKQKINSPYAIVLTPTRELALQVSEEIKQIGRYKRTKTLAIYGGQPIGAQINSLRKGVHVVVGTPGRILDHLSRGTLILDQIEILVLDEADEMLNMGFIEDIKKIIKRLPRNRQTMLFSATMPISIKELAKKYMTDPVIIETVSNTMLNPDVKQSYCRINGSSRFSVLQILLREEISGRVLIFCQTKREVEKLAQQLQYAGFRAGAMHGDFAQTKRQQVLRLFRTGSIRILVATDVAARGLHIPDVECVINYSVPPNPDIYIHRIGRTARAGRSGTAITLVTHKQTNEFKELCKHIDAKVHRLSFKKRYDRQTINNGKYKILSLIDAIEPEEEDLMLVDQLSERRSYREIAAALLQIYLSHNQRELPPTPQRNNKNNKKNKNEVHISKEIKDPLM